MLTCLFAYYWFLDNETATRQTLNLKNIPMKMLTKAVQEFLCYQYFLFKHHN